MFNPQNQKLTRVVKIILDFLFGLLVVAALLLTLWIVLSPIIMRVIDVPITASVHVTIGSGDDPQIPVEVLGSTTKGISNAFVTDARGTLRLETTNWSFVFISNLAQLLTAIGLASIVYLLRSVVTAILKVEPFSAQNVVNIRRMGFLVLLVGFLRPAVEYLSAQAILKQVTITEPELSLPSPFQVEVILASLLILVLAQVWSYGVELKHDQLLTI
jgi:hypothetical protein